MKFDIDKNPGMLSSVTHINGKKIGKPIREKNSEGKWYLTEYGKRFLEKKDKKRSVAMKMGHNSTPKGALAKAEKGEKQHTGKKESKKDYYKRHFADLSKYENN